MSINSIVGNGINPVQSMPNAVGQSPSPQIKEAGANISVQPSGVVAAQNQPAQQFRTVGGAGKYQDPNEKKLTQEMMDESVQQANKSLERVDRYIEREVHEKTHAVMYKLKDRNTGEVIAEFPPKKIQDMIAKMWELAGLFVDEKA